VGIGFGELVILAVLSSPLWVGLIALVVIGVVMRSRTDEHSRQTGKVLLIVGASLLGVILLGFGGCALLLRPH